MHAWLIYFLLMKIVLLIITTIEVPDIQEVAHALKRMLS